MTAALVTCQAKKDRGKASLLEGLSSERRGQFFGNDLYKQVAPDLGATNGVTQRSPLAEGAAAADSAGISSAPSQIPNNAMVGGTHCHPPASL
jgi:hypothetical protein|eukprot:COSAG01_NODE_14094_length_1496_cov_2.955619_1_plen_93_part_00